MTQAEFSEWFAIPLGTRRDWKRGARFPEAAARGYHRVISENSEAVCKAFKRSRERVPDQTSQSIYPVLARVWRQQRQAASSPF